MATYLKQNMYKVGLKKIEFYLQYYNTSADLWAWQGIFSGILAGKSKIENDKAMYGMKATFSVEKAIELNKGSALPHFARGYLKLYTPKQYGGDINTAISEFEKALKLFKDNEMKKRVVLILLHACKINKSTVKELYYKNYLKQIQN